MYDYKAHGQIKALVFLRFEEIACSRNKDCCLNYTAGKESVIVSPRDFANVIDMNATAEYAFCNTEYL